VGSVSDTIGFERYFKRLRVDQLAGRNNLTDADLKAIYDAEYDIVTEPEDYGLNYSPPLSQDQINSYADERKCSNGQIKDVNGLRYPAENFSDVNQKD
jgi:hypothetical protein